MNQVDLIQVVLTAPVILLTLLTLAHTAWTHVIKYRRESGDLGRCATCRSPRSIHPWKYREEHYTLHCAGCTDIVFSSAKELHKQMRKRLGIV